MKKIFFSLLAIAALASCAKTEAVFTQDNSEIKIAPVTAMTTKAQYGVMNGAYNPDEDFSVFAYWANEPAGSRFTVDQTGADYYLNDVKFVNKGLYWGGETTQYWPKNGSLRFAAYSPAEITMTHNLATDVYTLADFTYVDNFANSYDILVAPTSESYTAQTAAQNVSVVFEHALSWLSFNVMSTAAANGAFTVHSVTVDNVATQGTMVADMTTGVKDWTVVDASKKTITAYAGNADVYTASKSLDQKDNLVLPQPTTTITITFTQNAKNDAPALANQVLTIPLTLDADQPWEAGKKYTYTIVFDLDEILINPDVEDWEEVTVPEIDATATEVANQEELQTALLAGRNVRLAEDINLTETIVVGDAYVKSATDVDVTIDLNGKTITSVGDVFEVKDGTLTIVGHGNVKAAINNGEPFCAVWAYGDAVVNIYGGVYEIGYPVGDYNDLIYAKESATINIYGGEFMNSGRDNAFVLNLKDADRETAHINVSGGKFHNFDPSNNASECAGFSFLVDGFASYELEAGVWTVVDKEAKTVVNTEAALRDAAAQGGNVVLGADITVAESVMVAEGKELTLNLNGHNITNTNAVEDFGKGEALISYGTLTINGVGTVSSSTMAVWARGNANANITINGGTYKGCAEGFAKGGRSVAYASSGATITINGGTFEALAADKTSYANKTEGVKAALNVADNNGMINVYGGTFVGQNPAAPGTEPASWNAAHSNGFVAAGCKSVKDGDNYTVMAE